MDLFSQKMQLCSFFFLIISLLVFLLIFPGRGMKLKLLEPISQSHLLASRNQEELNGRKSKRKHLGFLHLINSMEKKSGRNSVCSGKSIKSLVPSYTSVHTLYNSAWQIEFIMDLSFSETIWPATKLLSHIGRIRTEYEGWQEIFLVTLPSPPVHTSIFEIPSLEIYKCTIYGTIQA